MSASAAVRGAMLVATVAWAAAEVLKIRRPYQIEPARRVWSAAVALALIHAALAFDVAYGWSHQAAALDTARRTAAVTGIAWGGGLFVNYLFLVSWLADAAWWWAAPVSYVHRPLWLERTRLAFFLFMFVNGAVVFAGATARAIGVPAVAAVCAAWLMRASRDSARA